MTISVDELVRQLATLGVVETAHNGSFHDLPGAGGGGSSNVRMLKATLTTSPGPSGSGSATITYGFAAPVAGPFVQVMTEVVSDEYDYALTFYPNSDGLSGFITSTATVTGSEDIALAYPVDVLVRIEPYVAS